MKRETITTWVASFAFSCMLALLTTLDPTPAFAAPQQDPTAAGIFAGIVGLLLLIGLVFGSYFLPSIVALVRGHRNTLAIFLLNLFLGWTLIGWVGALIWSALAETSKA